MDNPQRTPNNNTDTITIVPNIPLEINIPSECSKTFTYGKTLKSLPKKDFYISSIEKATEDYFLIVISNLRLKTRVWGGQQESATHGPIPPKTAKDIETSDFAEYVEKYSPDTSFKVQYYHFIGLLPLSSIVLEWE
jgi:hypothetical protein